MDLSNVSVLLITIRQWRKLSVDLKFQCDDPVVFRKILDAIQPGTWHYQKPTWAYKAVRAQTGHDVVNNTINYIQSNIIDKLNSHGSIIILKIVLENVTAQLQQVDIDKLNQAFNKYLVK